MFTAFLIKYAEIGIKGKNRYIFEDTLIARMNQALGKVEGNFSISKEMGRIYVNTEGPFDYEEAVEALQHVFGIAEICPVVIVESKPVEELGKDLISYVEQALSRHFYGTERGIRRNSAGGFSGNAGRCS